MARRGAVGPAEGGPGGPGVVAASPQDLAAAEVARAAVAAHAGERGPLLPVLHDVQDALGHVPPAAVRAVAEALNLSRADVHGVASFYDDFRTEAAGRVLVRVCRAEACQAVGAEELVAAADATLGLRIGRTSAAGVTVEQVFCFGNCALGPTVEVAGRIHGRMTVGRLADAVAAAEEA